MGVFLVCIMHRYNYLNGKEILNTTHSSKPPTKAIETDFADFAHFPQPRGFFPPDTPIQPTQ